MANTLVSNGINVLARTAIGIYCT